MYHLAGLLGLNFLIQRTERVKNNLMMLKRMHGVVNEFLGMVKGIPN